MVPTLRDPLLDSIRPMRPLAAVERFFERFFERSTARLFHTRVQPLQLQRRIERAMEIERLSGANRTIVPNRFAVHLSPADMADFADIAPSLATELADAALRFARAHRLTLADRPQVSLVADPGVAPGEIRVATRFADPPGGRPDGDEGPDGEADEGPSTRTMIYRVPPSEPPLAILREIRRDGSTSEITVDGRPLTLGRADDNGVVLDDDRVSRHHARISARRGALVLTDLGSTNGSRVNGIGVDEVVLGVGDRIQLGDTVLVVTSVGRD